MTRFIEVADEDALWLNGEKKPVEPRGKGKPLKETASEVFHRLRCELEELRYQRLRGLVVD